VGLLARMGEIKNTQKSLVVKSGRKRPIEGHENGRMWSRYMLLNWGQHCAFVNAVMNFRGSNLLISPSGPSFSRRTSLHAYVSSVRHILFLFVVVFPLYNSYFQSDLLYLLIVGVKVIVAPYHIQ